MEYREVEIATINESKHNPTIRTDRSNKDFIALKTNISKNGLINPISLGVGKRGMLLVAGHRRLNCYKDLGEKMIPSIINPKINDANYDKMFVAENVNSMKLSAAQETERWLGGAPEISPDVLQSIKISYDSSKNTLSFLLYSFLFFLPPKLLYSSKYSLKKGCFII